MGDWLLWVGVSCELMGELGVVVVGCVLVWVVGGGLWGVG